MTLLFIGLIRSNSKVICIVPPVWDIYTLSMKKIHAISNHTLPHTTVYQKGGLFEIYFMDIVLVLWYYLYLSLSIQSPWPPSMLNIGWQCSMPRTESKGVLGSFPDVLSITPVFLPSLAPSSSSQSRHLDAGNSEVPCKPGKVDLRRGLMWVLHKGPDYSTIKIVSWK